MTCDSDALDSLDFLLWDDDTVRSPYPDPYDPIPVILTVVIAICGFMLFLLFVK